MRQPNRVTPEGTFIATPARGMFTGNRGCLHDQDGVIGAARWRHPHWIVCALEWKGWRRQIRQPNRWTELFFLDEAVALAAGHRPCALCRRAAFDAYREALGIARAPAVDAALHAARVGRDRQQITRRATLDTLPDGAFIRHDGAPHLVLGARLLPYAPEGYGTARPRPGGAEVIVLTPKPSIAALREGYRPVLHPTAG